MSQRPKPPMKKPPPPPPPEEEEEEEEEFDEDEEFGETDLLDALGSWFTTEEGDTVASALVGLKTAVETQNKILIKILSALGKPAAPKPVSPAAEEDIPA
jgi:hypothetical protein